MVESRYLYSLGKCLSKEGWEERGHSTNKPRSQQPQNSLDAACWLQVKCGEGIWARTEQSLRNDRFYFFFSSTLRFDKPQKDRNHFQKDATLFIPNSEVQLQEVNDWNFLTLLPSIILSSRAWGTFSCFLPAWRVTESQTLYKKTAHN